MGRHEQKYWSCLEKPVENDLSPESSVDEKEGISLIVKALQCTQLL